MGAFETDAEMLVAEADAFDVDEDNFDAETEEADAFDVDEDTFEAEAEAEPDEVELLAQVALAATPFCPKYWLMVA